jgi:hypothetical protein
MLRDRRLSQTQGRNNLAYRSFAGDEKKKDVASTWLRDGIKNVGSGGRSRHV